MLLWLVEQAGWRFYYSDSQTLTLSSANMKSLQLAALYTLPYRLTGDAQSPLSFHYGYVVLRGMVHKLIP